MGEEKASNISPIFSVGRLEATCGDMEDAETQAEQVRTIFAVFQQTGSARRTLEEIDRRGWRLKSWTRKNGGFRAGDPFTLSGLRRLLSNILYTGAIRHKVRSTPTSCDCRTWRLGTRRD